MSLASAAAVSIEVLAKYVASDRLKLAAQHRRDANVMIRQEPPLYRSAISRYYYAMYHAMRAATFVFHGGDDFEEHSKLPLNLPADFPDKSKWQTALKDARLARNAADYDPYPRSNSSWQIKATSLKITTASLMTDVKAYLIGKGCTRI